MATRKSIEELVQLVLDGTDLKLHVDRFRVEENPETQQADIRCEVHHVRTGERKVIEGSGVGIVDACFHGLVDMYSPEYPSLKTVRFADFTVKAKMDTARDDAGSDSMADVSLRVANSEGREYTFTDSSPSLMRSSVAVVLHAAEFFINSERAFIAVYTALQHARQEKRADSVARYTAQLTTLVEATSYSDVIEGIKRQELKD